MTSHSKSDFAFRAFVHCQERSIQGRLLNDTVTIDRDGESDSSVGFSVALFMYLPNDFGSSLEGH